MPKLKRIGLGGGCHWCTEGVFVSLAGVGRVAQGWISSTAPWQQPSEAVIVHYDTEQISLRTLIEVHLQTHAATVAHPLRHKYRSAVYVFAEDALDRVGGLLDEVAVNYPEPLQTQVLPFVSFSPSLPEHRDYYRSDPERPFCRRYITPKLNRLRRDQPELFFSNEQ